MSKGAIMITLIALGIGLGILGWAQAESVHVAEIKPLSHAIEVANHWLWFCAYPGIGLIAIGFVLLASGWGKNDSK